METEIQQREIKISLRDFIGEVRNQIYRDLQEVFDDKLLLCKTIDEYLPQDYAYLHRDFHRVVPSMVYSSMLQKTQSQ